MKKIRVLSHYYVNLMVKLWLVHFSLLLASALVMLAMLVQMVVTLLLSGEVASIDVGMLSLFRSTDHPLSGLLSVGSGRTA